MEELVKEEISQRSIRFSDLPFYKPGVEVILGGAGGIGSWLGTLLSRLECKIYVYDFDNVETANLGGQLYKSSDIGLPKVAALANNCRDFSNIPITDMGKFEQDSMVGPIVFSCFDNMTARRQMFENWCKLDSREIFIDGRK